MRHLLTVICVLIGVTAMQGCHKEDPEKRPYMKAVVQKTPFSTYGDQVQLLRNGTAPYIYCNTGEVTIWLELDTVSLGAHSLSLGQATIQRGGFTSYSISGAVNITAVKPYVVGSFAFSCNDSTVVTGGEFLVYNE